MISLAHTDQFMVDLKREYDNFATILTGRYLAIQAAAGAKAAPFFVEQFAGLAREHIKQFITSADNRIDGWVADLGNGVDLSERSDALKRSLRSTALRNGSDLAQRLRGGSVGLKDLFSRPMGAYGSLVQAKLTKPDLKSLDTSGRLWDSSALVAVMGRDFAYQSFIDTQAYHLALDGDLARVSYDDPDQPYRGMVVSLSGANPKHQSFADVRKLIFHPNASAQLVSHV